MSKKSRERAKRLREEKRQAQKQIMENPWAAAAEADKTPIQDVFPAFDVGSNSWCVVCSKEKEGRAQVWIPRDRYDTMQKALAHGLAFKNHVNMALARILEQAEKPDESPEPSN